MSCLTGRRRHILRYVVAFLVALLIGWQLFFRTGRPYHTSTHRHLKDPVQELKDLGAYIPVHKAPQPEYAWPENIHVPDAQSAERIKQVELTEGVKGLQPEEKEKAREIAAIDVKEGLKKIKSVEEERSASASASAGMSEGANAISKVQETYAEFDAHATTTFRETSSYTPAHAPSNSSRHGYGVHPTLSHPHATNALLRPTALSSTNISSPTVSPSLHPSAHTLPSADAFHAHFAALRHQRNLTVRSAMSTCAWPSNASVNFQFGADAEWAVSPRSDSDIAAYRDEWLDFVLHESIPYSAVADRFAGRGIVIVAGNERSLKRTFVLLRLLREWETDLPVEIQYHGDEELSSANKTALQRTFPSVTFLDLASPANAVNASARGFINYNLKTAALLNSRFAEPLLLDSDNLPVADPAVLYASHTYREYGTVFWPDIARTRPENPIWAITNTACRMDEYEMESGQLLVDKRRYWYHLQLAKFWSDREDYGEFLLGDKDTFRFAWRALRTEFGAPKRWLTSVGVVQRPRDEIGFPEDVGLLPEGNVSASAMSRSREPRTETQGGGVYCGHSFAQHHPDDEDGRIMFLHGGLVKTLHPLQIGHARTFGTGLFAAYKESRVATEWGEVEEVGIKWDGGSYLEEDEQERMEYAAHCTDMPEVAPGVLGDEWTREVEGWESVVARAGFYWMVGDEGEFGDDEGEHDGDGWREG